MNSHLSSIAPALANHLWQSTVFAASVCVLTLLLRRNQARIRYSLWLAASLKFLLPLSILVGLAGSLPQPQRAITTPAMYAAVDGVAQPFTQPFAQLLVQDTMRIPPPAPVPNSKEHLKDRLATRLPQALAAIWLCGMAVVLLVWSMRWAQVAAMLRRAARVDEGREVELLRRVERATGARKKIPLRLSQNLMEPGIFGIFRPVLLWPQRLSERLDDAHIEAILTHERMHVRRRDNLTASLHMLVEALFWFHPAVWWIERRMVEERERACDEAVVQMGGKPDAYAESLLKACRFCVESPLTCVSGITGADLKQRVVEIMTARVVRKLTLGKKLLLLAVALLAVAVPIMLGQGKAAQRMALATLNSLPTAKAAIAVEETPSIGDELQASGAATDASANTPASGPAFETVTIRPANTNNQQRMFGIQFTPSGRLIISSMPLKTLIMFAHMSAQTMPQVAGGSQWANSDQFDITAQVDKADMAGWDKLADSERNGHMQQQLQTLLEQRFKLKGHTAMISTPAYILVQAKGGSKLHEVPAPTPAELQADEQRQKANKATDPPRLGLDVTSTGWVGHAVNIQELMNGLGYALSAQDKPLLDQTGLTGYYDLTLKLIKQDGGPTPAQQVEEQLGLRLETRNVPMKTFVIDSAEKPKFDAAELAAATSDVAPTPPPPPHIDFEVVSWKHCAANAPKGSGRVDLPIDSDFIAYHCQPINRIIYFAFTGPAPFHLSGHPSWVDDDLYEFTAKVAPKDIAAWQAMTINDKRIAVRDILADQLKLKIHVDKTPQPAYGLTVAKGGPKLTEYKEGEQWKVPDGRILEGRQHVFIGDITYMQNSDMNNLAANLSARLDRPVIDQTGLTGTYDVSLPLAKTGVADPFTATGDNPSVESGLERLGLKLVPSKIEADGLLVDHIERPPEN